MNLPEYSRSEVKFNLLTLLSDRDNTDPVPREATNSYQHLSNKCWREVDDKTLSIWIFTMIEQMLWYAGTSCSPKPETEILVLAPTFVFVSAQPLIVMVVYYIKLWIDLSGLQILPEFWLSLHILWHQTIFHKINQPSHTFSAFAPEPVKNNCYQPEVCK